MQKQNIAFGSPQKATLEKKHRSARKADRKADRAYRPTTRTSRPHAKAPARHWPTAAAQIAACCDEIRTRTYCCSPAAGLRRRRPISLKTGLISPSSYARTRWTTLYGQASTLHELSRQRGAQQDEETRRLGDWAQSSLRSKLPCIA